MKAKTWIFIQKLYIRTLWLQAFSLCCIGLYLGNNYLSDLMANIPHILCTIVSVIVPPIYVVCKYCNYSSHRWYAASNGVSEYSNDYKLCDDIELTFEGWLSLYNINPTVWKLEDCPYRRDEMIAVRFYYFDSLKYGKFVADTEYKVNMDKEADALKRFVDATQKDIEAEKLKSEQLINSAIEQLNNIFDKENKDGF